MNNKIPNFRILSPEEVSEVKILKSKKLSSNSPIYEILKKLKIGEGMIIKKDQWQIKSAPTYILNQHQKGKNWGDKKMSCRQLEDKSGWLIIRIK